MKAKNKLLLVVLVPIFLTSFLSQMSSVLPISNNDSENLVIPKTEIKREPVYGVEYSHIEIPSKLVSSSMYSVNISVKNTGTDT